MENLYASKIFLKMAGCMPLILPPAFANGRTLQKPSKESGTFTFQSLGTIRFVLFLLKSRVKRGGHDTMFPLA